MSLLQSFSLTGGLEFKELPQLINQLHNRGKRRELVKVFLDQ